MCHGGDGDGDIPAMELTHNGDDLANSSHCERRTTASDSGHLKQDNDGGNDGDRAVSFFIPVDGGLKFREKLESEMKFLYEI
jgi:hypothetical protein